MGGLSPIEWVFGRDLLLDAMHSRVGDGDVRLTPFAAAGILVIDLRSPNGSGSFTCSLKDVVRFLAETIRLVPRTAEQEAVDRALTSYLAEDSDA